MVARYLMEQGYEIVPINPGQRQILGQPCFKSLLDLPFEVDMANLFLNPKRVPRVVDQAIEKGIPIIWMQLGVIHNDSARRAREAGIQVIMNKCVKVEHQRMMISGSL
ncbi:MAG: CoA-binding protein [Deltaproteobacteria bacterium]|nr:MAG: CoA-binding protein [Deltaproteobacteria bacterium]